MTQQLQILHLEDDATDAELVQATLLREGVDCCVRVVATRSAFVAALEEGGIDLVLADYSLPDFDGMRGLAIVRERFPDLPFVFVSGRLGEEAAIESLRSGATDYVLKNRLTRLAPAVQRALAEAGERAELKKAEESLRESELRRYQMQVELACAADMQARLLPSSYPDIPGFEVVARCLPAKQVGGDFYDWQEVSGGIWSLTLGDVMGKGMAAAMLMATVRASIRAATHKRPAEALRLASKALLPDLDTAESFVTLFHAQLNALSGRLVYVDCGHGYAFVRRADGTVKGLSPRGLPLGVPGQKSYREGTIHIAHGDTLVLYSDGLIDARPELALNNQILAVHMRGATTAREMLERLIELPGVEGPLPDDMTVLVAHCSG